MTLEEKIDELTSLVRVLATKIDWLEQDIAEVKALVGDLGTLQFEAFQKKTEQENASNWKMERL